MPTRDGCRLRPMEEGDLDLVREWRNAERIRRVSYTDHLIGRDEHRTWFERVVRSDATAPFVFECEGRPVGVVNLVDIDRAESSCVWGFFIGAEDAPRGAGGAMGFCALEHVFEQSGLTSVRGEALAGNESSIRYHRRLGFELVDRLVDGAEKSGESLDVLVFTLREPVWAANREALFARMFSDSGSGDRSTTL
jgi:UDP-4-amino-4,6-dideoxy-N-acetyl-beta-L-altrosamine N-acetyltransferase